MPVTMRGVLWKTAFEVLIKKYWSEKLAAPSKPFPPFDEAKLAVLRSILAELPKSFEPRNLKAVVGASGNPDPLSATSPASGSKEYIILFPKAFTDLGLLKRVLAHEVVHFLARREWRGSFEKYKSISGWSSLPKGMVYRKGSFVEIDGQFSAEEDFANNIEYFMFDPSKLKATNPEIFAWIQKNFAKSLILRSCSNAQ